MDTNVSTQKTTRTQVRHMMRGAAALATLAGVLSVGAPDAHAQVQDWEGRGFLNVNGLYQAQSRELVNTGRFTIYGEDGDFDNLTDIGSGALFDVSGGVRVWRNLALGVGVSRFTKSEAARIDVSVPHPLFFDSSRDISIDLGELDHKETAVHILGVWLMPLNDRFDVSVFAGPSIFLVSQHFVGDVTVSDIQEVGPPFDTVTLPSLRATKFDETTVGFNFGVDATYMFNEWVGAGGLVRYSGASVDLNVGRGRDVSVDVGGFQLGGGLRVRF